MSKAYSSVELFSFNSAVAFVGLSPFHNPNDTAQTLLTDVNIGIYNKANSSAIKFHTFTVHKQEIVYRFSSSLTKLIVFYKDTSQNIVLIGHSLDLANGRVFDLTFTDADHLKATLSAGVGLFSLSV